MGDIRARTDEEVKARKNEIIDAAKRQISEMNYEDITLATIAKDTSLSRSSIYNYYKTKERIFIEILIEEYLHLEKDMHIYFKEKLTQIQFCRKLTEMLLNKKILLKILSLQLPIRYKKEYNDEILELFVVEALPYQKTLEEVLTYQFPDADADAKNTFRIQLSVYCNSLYILENLPKSQMDKMAELAFNKIPSAFDICFEGLMLLSNVLL